MSDPKGDKLIVNLSAAQTRKRLKGFGHGVRKVHSAGKNRAVVIHTATGRRLDELREAFDDAGCAGREEDLPEPIDNMRNLGPTSAARLRDAGIADVETLRRLGPVAAYRIVDRHWPEAGLNLLWAMAAGLSDRDWRELTENEKQSLLKELRFEESP